MWKQIPEMRDQWREMYPDPRRTPDPKPKVEGSGIVAGEEAKTGTKGKTEVDTFVEEHKNKKGKTDLWWEESVDHWILHKKILI